MNEAWEIFRENERYEDDTCRCFYCGNEASGDVTMEDEECGEVVVCDDAENCPDNLI